jgi:hypothetical protein
MARASADDNDKALWLTLAQSWVRLAAVARSAAAENEPHDDADVLALQASD